MRCPKCGGKNFPDGNVGCSYCNSDSNTNAGIFGNSDPKQPEITVRRQIDEESASRNHLVPKSMPLDCKATEQNREENKSNYQTIKKIVQELRANKQGRQEIGKKAYRNCKSIHETSAAANRMSSGNSHFIDIRKAILNNESQWNMGRFQGPQKDNAPVNEAFLNKSQWNEGDNISSSVPSHGPQFSLFVEDSRRFNTLGTSQDQSDPYDSTMFTSDSSHNCKRSSKKNLSMTETNLDDKIFKSKISSKRGKCVSAGIQQDITYDETLGLNTTSQMTFHNRTVAGVDGQLIESHYDTYRIARNKNEPCGISDVVASNSFCYSDLNLAASGSSGCHRDENTPNVVGKMNQSLNKGEIKSTKYEEVKALICGSCKEEISQQVDEENVLEYFDSLYYNLEGTHLLIHRPTHVLKTTCNICGKEHAIGNLHKSEHRCLAPFCRMTFPCRTRLYQHIPEHGNYFKNNCWVCRRKFSDHIAGNDSFVCCVCGHLSNLFYNLEIHNRFHLPKCLCNLCEKEFSVHDKNFHGIEAKCIVCNDIFNCRIQLEEHFESHVKYFSEHCRIRETNVKQSFFRCPICDSFEASNEVTFKYHLYEHAKLFDCETCGRLFSRKSSLKGHTPTCKALPYKCEICETRFHTIDLLYSHGLLKH